MQGWRIHAARAGLPEAGFRHSSGGPQQLPARSLVCVLGGRSEEYDRLAVDGLCDVALVPYYALPAGGDTFLNDDHAVTQAVLQMAAKAIKTTYGIHVPLKKLLQAKNDLNRQKSRDRMKNYWVEHNIYHYAVLDLEIGPNGKAASNVVRRVFALLKLFAKIQDAIRHELSLERKTEAQPDAYVILGVHLWVSTNDKLFKALQKNVRSFSISALIARTHITERDHNGCKTNGPAPYEIENNDNIMGMANAVAYVRTFAWVQRTSLAVSFTLCTRWYRPKKEFLVGVDCLRDAVTVSSSGTMCSLSIEYRRLNLAVALFDVECDDWHSECKRPSASHMRRFERTRRMRAYLRGLQSSSYSNGNVTATCQGMQRKVLI
ncbi:hypothetical protein HPB50_001845 [Hyalomma asiaticum]|uniref:Uncharacterized protein n=1 Tax=Hyalomma asiaticum TaxID=266040 RepID=A0ACB7SB57_HYAAI|nr:hypothetical protein HPB50_001845 [Hyalomma asiaticum]